MKTYKKPLYYNKVRNSVKKSIQNQGVQKQVSPYKRKLYSIQPPIKSVAVSRANLITTFFASMLGLGTYPQRGGQVNQRLGSDIMLKSLEIRYTFSYTNDLPDPVPFSICRISVIQFTGQNADGGFPTSSGTISSAIDLVYVPPHGSTTHANNLVFNTQTKQDYRVLYDKVHNLSLAGHNSENGHVMITKFPVPKLHFQTDVSDPHLPSLSSGLIAIFIASSNSDVPYPIFNSITKLNFTDT